MSGVGEPGSLDTREPADDAAPAGRGSRPDSADRACERSPVGDRASAIPPESAGGHGSNAAPRELSRVRDPFSPNENINLGEPADMAATGVRSFASASIADHGTSTSHERAGRASGTLAGAEAWVSAAEKISRDDRAGRAEIPAVPRRSVVAESAGRIGVRSFPDATEASLVAEAVSTRATAQPAADPAPAKDRAPPAADPAPAGDRAPPAADPAPAKDRAPPAPDVFPVAAEEAFAAKASETTPARAEASPAPRKPAETPSAEVPPASPAAPAAGETLAPSAISEANPEEAAPKAAPVVTDFSFRRDRPTVRPGTGRHTWPGTDAGTPRGRRFRILIRAETARSPNNRTQKHTTAPNRIEHPFDTIQSRPPLPCCQARAGERTRTITGHQENRSLHWGP
ncbi:hypothetical protein A4R44_06205 [Amycolatopsis sp. M39]|nr:hypothetical protein A4R44_06205 [Amycolatopsis sp. M39]